MCIALHYARQAACPRGSHQFSFSFARLRSIRESMVYYPPVSISAQFMSCSPSVNQEGTMAYCPQYVLAVFFCLQNSDQSGMIVMWALGQSCLPTFYYSLCTLHIYERHQLYQILFILSTSKSIFYSVPVNQFLLSVPIQQVQ